MSASKKDTKAAPAAETTNAPAVIDDSTLSMLREDAHDGRGAGLEDMQREDYVVPAIVILQSMSPQLKKAESAYIEDAEEGHLCDTTTERLWDGATGIVVIPVSYRRAHIEWKPNRGGFVKDHGIDANVLSSCTRGGKNGNENVLPNGNTISVVGEFIVLLLDRDEDGAFTGDYTPYVLRMASTMQKKARQWNSIMMNWRMKDPANNRMFNPAMFARPYLLTTTPEKNEHGSWFGWKIKTLPKDGAPSGLLTTDLEGGAEIYQYARDFNRMVKEGSVTTAPPAAEAYQGAGGGGESDDDPM